MNLLLNHWLILVFLLWLILALYGWALCAAAARGDRLQSLAFQGSRFNSSIVQSFPSSRPDALSPGAGSLDASNRNITEAGARRVLPSPEHAPARQTNANGVERRYSRRSTLLLIVAAPRKSAIVHVRIRL